MEEKILVKSQSQFHSKTFAVIVALIAVVAIAVSLFMFFSMSCDGESIWKLATDAYEEASRLEAEYRNERIKVCYHITVMHDRFYSDFVSHISPMWTCPLEKDSATAFAYSFSLDVFERLYGIEFYTLIAICISVPLFLLIIYWWLKRYELVVTDKRAYGRAAFGKRVDLPLDSISAVGTMWLKGIAVSTSSGKVSFLMMKNRDEIHKCVSELLIERQSKVAVSPVAAVKQENIQSSADEIKKFKELLDSGAITQEEFDIKKKQLLGL